MHKAAWVLRMERNTFVKRLYIGRDLLISGRTRLKQCHLTLGSFTSPLLPFSPCPSMHAHTHTQSPMRHPTALVTVQSLARGSMEATASQGVFVKRHQIPDLSHGPVLWLASCNGSQGSHLWTSGGRGRGLLTFWWQLVCTINHTDWVAFSHGTQGSNPYCFPWSPERRVYDLSSAAINSFSASPSSGLASSPKPHRQSRGVMVG